MNLEHLPIEFQCPRCAFYNTATFREAGLETMLICRGCKRFIHLNDSLGELTAANRAVKRALAELHSAFEG